MPAVTLWATSCKECRNIQNSKYEVMVQISQIAVAAISLICISRNLRKYGPEKFLLLDRYHDQLPRFCHAYIAQLCGDGVLYLKVDPSGADAWRLEPVIELIKGGAVGVIPTDTVYAIVCDLKNRSAVERLHRVKKMDAKKPLGILCRSFRDIDTYTTGFPHGNSEGQTNIFRAARQCLPGPYTFILPASKEMPKECTKFGTAKSKYAPRKSVGVRMPNDPICQAILGKLDGPLLCSSVRWPVDDRWIIDPAIIADIYGSTKGQDGVDFVVDGGIRVAEPSTVIDMTGNEPLLLRKGKGALRDWMLPKANDFSWGG